MMDNEIELCSIYEEVHAELPGCPKPIIVRECRRILVDFCTKTKSWQHDAEPINIVADQIDYPIEDVGNLDQECYLLDSVISVTQAGRLLAPMRDYHLPSRGTLRLTRTPKTSTANALLLRVSLIPSSGLTAIEDEPFAIMWRYNLDTLAQGVMEKCLAMNGAAWSNPNQAAICRKRYLDGRVAERIRIQKAGTNGILYMTPRTPFIRPMSRTSRRSSL